MEKMLPIVLIWQAEAAVLLKKESKKPVYLVLKFKVILQGRIRKQQGPNVELFEKRERGRNLLFGNARRFFRVVVQLGTVRSELVKLRQMLVRKVLEVRVQISRRKLVEVTMRERLCASIRLFKIDED